MSKKQPNKIKVYTDSKADDCTIHSGVIKRHILPKKCSQRYEIKIINSKKDDEQCKLTRSSIKKKYLK